LRVLAVSFSGCSTMLATCSFDKSVTVFNVTTGEIVSVYAEDNPIWTIAWSPDSNFIATGNKTGPSVIMRLSPLVCAPRVVRSNWTGLMRQRPYLWRLPRPSDDESGRLSTPLNDISSHILKPLLESKACSIKFGNLSRRLVNPRCAETKGQGKTPTSADAGATEHNTRSKNVEGGKALDPSTWLSPLDRALKVDDDHHKCKLLASLVDVACDDGDSTFSEWIASLAGKNNALLTEILHVCVVPTESVAYSERIIMPEERVILPCDKLNPRWPERRRPGDRSKMRWELKKRDEDEYRSSAKRRRAVASSRRTWRRTEGTSEFLFSQDVLNARFTKHTRNMKERGVETVAIGPPHFIKEAFPQIVEDGSVPVFETEVMQYAVDYLWLKLRWFYLLQVSLYLLLLGFFTLGHVLNLGTLAAADPLSDDPSVATPRLLARLAYAASVVLSVFFLVQEIRQMCRSGFCGYFEGGWNVLELGAYALTMMSVIWTELALPWQNIVGAVAMMWIWTGLLSHLRGISAFGGIIATFVQILLDTGGFMGIMAVFWIGGAMAFKVLLPGSGDFANFNALLSVWYMILGDPIPDSFVIEGTPSGVNGTDMEYGIHGVVTAQHALWTQITAQVLSTGFVFTIMIVLLNQLIALMGDSYAKVMDDYAVQTRRSRAKVIVSLIELYGFCVRDHENVLRPRWLHVLRPMRRGGGGAGDGGNWEGNLKAIKRDIASSRKEMNVKLTQTEEEMAHKMERMASNFQTSTDEILAKLKALTALSRRRVAPG
jgi:hypothetical protein